jgi:hypothetical protein
MDRGTARRRSGWVQLADAPFGSPDMMASPSDWSPDGKYLLLNAGPRRKRHGHGPHRRRQWSPQVTGKTPSRRDGRFPRRKYIVFDAESQ